ncbi:DUF3408 domain-containing protein [Ornithobacterium rhinotracheale]|uniref:DUF3408 domain-containing protein n=1 Tax=Ornithobacterium rhinotracheale (strain ATCC 51463 / DSM 15997 / CCUG 23171 / CIP 104009 / LMG 9086) TaxID=867902 RepID=I4A2J1_ORNRL|nr:DUF3408 domain-containing protein [Ornithobacterium rhinotracheale]AFL98175.1 Protein of unknown function (DUF3408) [Ornithobacterium rhinotracheale DSM 15997]AIP99923.1 conjugal transfer protein TraB [Ornithobacterium rhinotracheale ORT-UMN 88]KGB66090.1 conjugal transfer protein TraB [Ornithobacterium rhinotracheale H06-030791]MBN3661792.1 DUF3408 domain-containing protein [Ornithobacterium rhinotracheale]MCK0193525.1 DUF3408 domain-containing protein [Ornithobacterium rhinotracheale]
MSKKRNPINESELMELMAGKREEISVVKDSAKTSEPIKDEIVSDNKTQNIEPANMLKPEQKASTSTRLKKTDVETYESLFFSSGETSARNGKSVYIRPEFHRRIVQIVQVIGEDKISIYNYLDNLLKDHFNRYEKEIKKAFKDKYKPIF